MIARIHIVHGRIGPRRSGIEREADSLGNLDIAGDLVVHRDGDGGGAGAGLGGVVVLNLLSTVLI